MPSPPSTVRASLLDATRGAAVVSVVAYHCFTLAVADGRPDGALGPGWWILGAGRLGVDLFFVLSGFLLAGSWQSTRRRHDGDPGGALREYASRRARRILPAYWISLAILIPLSAPALLTSLDGLGRIALFATLQQYVVQELPGQVNLVYWSLTTEVHFYLLLPLLAALLARFGGQALVPAFFALSVAWRVWTPGDLPDSWIFGRLDQFVAGMAAAGAVVAADAGRRSRLVELLTGRQAGWVLGTALAAVALYHGARFSSGSGSVPGGVLVHPVAGLLIAGLLVRAVVTARDEGGIGRVVLGGAGRISFSLYLWHFPILHQGLGLLRLTEPGTPAVSMVAGLPALVAVAVGVSVVSYRFVERPFLARKRGPAVPVAEPALAVQPA